MKGHGSKFGRKKDEAIAALMTQRNIEDAAKAVGIAPNTLLKWMKEPEFDKSYRAARRATFGQSVAQLQQAAPAAVTKICRHNGQVSCFQSSNPPRVSVHRSALISSRHRQGSLLFGVCRHIGAHRFQREEDFWFCRGWVVKVRADFPYPVLVPAG